MKSRRKTTAPTPVRSKKVGGKLDLRRDFSAIYSYVAKRAQSFDAKTHQGLGGPGKVKLIELGFQCVQAGWMALVFDTRRDATPDGQWTLQIEGNDLPMPHWCEMADANMEQPITLLLLDGSKSVLPSGSELAVPLGEMLKAVLLKARTDGIFAQLPMATGCQLHVEDHDGAYGWPDYDDLGEENKALVGKTSKSKSNSDAPKPLPKIHDAAEAGDLKSVKALLKSHPDLVSKKSRDHHETPLHKAADKGHKEVVDFLLASKAKVNAANTAGKTPLHCAAEENHKEVVKSLLAKKADLDAKDNDGHTPLHFAAAKGSKEAAELLLASKAQVNAPGGTGMTPLHWAISREQNSVAKLLLAKKADIHAKEEDGHTPLHEAASGGNKEIMELLLARGADVNARSNYDKTPLALAIIMGQTAAAKLLRQHGGRK